MYSVTEFLLFLLCRQTLPQTIGKACSLNIVRLIYNGLVGSRLQFECFQMVYPRGSTGPSWPNSGHQTVL